METKLDADVAPFVRSCLILGLAVTAGFFTVAGFAFTVRLLPWLFAPEVPFGVSIPFGRALLSRALESAMILGMPIGFGIAAARFVERGEARSLHALGVGPLAFVSSLVVPAGLVASVYLAWGANPYDSPGRFARELLAEGRASCAGSGGRRAAEVPLVGLTWLCFPSLAPVVTGRVPGVGEKVWFTSARLSPSDDLRRFEAEDLHLSMMSGGVEVRLKARSARIAGLPSWGRPATLHPLLRAAVAGSAGWLLALTAVYAVLAAGISSGLAAAVLGGLTSLFVLLGISMLDGAKSVPSSLAYAALPLVGAIGNLGLGVLFERFLPSLLGRQRDDRDRRV